MADDATAALTSGRHRVREAGPDVHDRGMRQLASALIGFSVFAAFAGVAASVDDAGTAGAIRGIGLAVCLLVTAVGSMWLNRKRAVQR